MYEPTTLRGTVLVLLFCLFLVGCQSDESVEMTDFQQSSEKAPETIADQPGASPKIEPAGEKPQSDGSEAETEEEPELAISYEPPFPARVDLFVPPKRERSVAKNKQKEGNVELLGFANVDGRQSVLSIIDGSVYTLCEGETCSGVEVISIKPPAVVMQRGRQIWQASLAN